MENIVYNEIDNDDDGEMNYMKFVVKDRDTQKQLENYLQEISNKYFDQVDEEDLDYVFNISVFQDNEEFITTFSVPFDDEINYEIIESIEEKFGDSVKNVPYYYAKGGFLGGIFGGKRTYKKGLAYKLDRAKHNKSEDWEVPMKNRKKRYANGGGVDKYVGEYKGVARGRYDITITKDSDGTYTFYKLDKVKKTNNKVTESGLDETSVFLEALKFGLTFMADGTVKYDNGGGVGDKITIKDVGGEFKKYGSGGGVKDWMNEKTRAVIIRIQKNKPKGFHKINGRDYIYTTYIADVAEDMGIRLTGKEMRLISEGFNESKFDDGGDFTFSNGGGVDEIGMFHNGVFYKLGYSEEDNFYIKDFQEDSLKGFKEVGFDTEREARDYAEELIDSKYANDKTYGELYNKIVLAVMKDIKVSREKAEDIVNKNEGWLTDMIEYEGETNVTFLADQITTTDEGLYANGGGVGKKSFYSEVKVGNKDGSSFGDDLYLSYNKYSHQDTLKGKISATPLRLDDAKYFAKKYKNSRIEDSFVKEFDQLLGKEHKLYYVIVKNKNKYANGGGEFKKYGSGGGVKDWMNEKTRAVIIRIQKNKPKGFHKINGRDYIYTTYIADVAEDMGIRLTGKEMRLISEGFNESKFDDGGGVNKNWDSFYNGEFRKGGGVGSFPFIKFEDAQEAIKKVNKGELPKSFSYVEKEKSLYYLPNITGDWVKLKSFETKDKAIDWVKDNLKSEGFAKGGGEGIEGYKYSNGGGVEDYDYYGSMTDESVVMQNCSNGEIHCDILEEIIGSKPEYPYQQVGSIRLQKCYLRPYYKIS